MIDYSSLICSGVATNLNEEGSIDRQVYVQNGMAIGTLLLDKKVSDKLGCKEIS